MLFARMCSCAGVAALLLNAAACAVRSEATASAPEPGPPPAGCYSAVLGEWDIPPEVPDLQTPPAEFVIRRVDGDTRWALEPAIGAGVTRAEVMADSVFLDWDGRFFLGVRIRARMQGDTLFGFAQTWTDLRGPRRARAEWRAHLTRCGDQAETSSGRQQSQRRYPIR
jgi:hypothetical protein